MRYLELKAPAGIANPKFPAGSIWCYPYPSNLTKAQGLDELRKDKLFVGKLLVFPPPLENCAAFVQVEPGVWEVILNPTDPKPDQPKDDGLPRINFLDGRFEIGIPSWLLLANARGAADVRIVSLSNNGFPATDYTPAFRFDGNDAAGSYQYVPGHLPAGKYRAYWRPHNNEEAAKVKTYDFTVTPEQANKTRPVGGGGGDSDLDYSLLNDALVESGNDGNEQVNEGGGTTQRQPKSVRILTPNGTTTTEGFQFAVDAELTYDDNSTEDVSVDEQTDWQAPEPNTILGGILYVPEDGVYGVTRTVIISVTHRGLTATKAITVLDGTVPANRVVGLDIEGQGDILEGTGENFRRVKILSDNSRVYTSDGELGINDAGGTNAYMNSTTPSRLELPANNVQDDSSVINLYFQLGDLTVFKDVLAVDGTVATVPRFERITRRSVQGDLYYYVATSRAANGSFQPLEWRHKPNFQGNPSAFTDWQPYGGAISVDFDGYTYARALLYTGGGGAGTTVTYEFRIEGNNASILSDTFVLQAQNSPESITVIYPNP